ncbi:MAG: hypothetical protein J6Y37_00020 [Paludibacteraceae bacterium]|nr:hypothetical protein [Paludibacteraceae bacterium]
MRKFLFIISLFSLGFISNVFAQGNMSLINAFSDSSVSVGGLRRAESLPPSKPYLYVINGVVLEIQNIDENPLIYLAAIDIEDLMIIKAKDNECIDAILFIKTRKGKKLHKKLREMMKNAGSYKYQIPQAYFKNRY